MHYDYFKIERSNDGHSFESRDKVKGAGTSNIIHNYSFNETDGDDPVLYYRLMQVDFNGSSHPSRVIALPKNPSGELTLNVIPNPVGTDKEFALHITGITSGQATIKIVDMMGRPVYNKFKRLGKL